MVDRGKLSSREYKWKDGERKNEDRNKKKLSQRMYETVANKWNESSSTIMFIHIITNQSSTATLPEIRDMGT